MCCDYYVQSEMVFEYSDKYGVMHKTTTNTIVEKQYIMSVPDNDSDDDFETQLDKYDKEIKKCITKNTYNKMLYEDGRWIKESYKKRYTKQVLFLCPNLHKLLKVYKSYLGWERI